MHACAIIEARHDKALRVYYHHAGLLTTARDEFAMAIVDATTGLKYCPGCKQHLPGTSEKFGALKSRKDGMTVYCRACTRTRAEAYRATHLDHVREYAREYRSEKYWQDPDAARAYNREWSQTHKENQKIATQKYRQKGAVERAAKVLERKRQQEQQREAKRLEAARLRQLRQVEQPLYPRYRETPTEKALFDKLRKRASAFRGSNNVDAAWQPPEKVIGGEGISVDELPSGIWRDKAQSCNDRAMYKGIEGLVYADDLKAVYVAQKGRCRWCERALDQTFHVDHILALSRGGLNTIDNVCCTCSGCNLSKGTRRPILR